jgi:phospholipid/cholesterol/gamma-HCH transport system permease protein
MICLGVPALSASWRYWAESASGWDPPCGSIDQYESVAIRGNRGLLDFLKKPVGSFQDYLLLAGSAFKNVLRSPHYYPDVSLQMDIIGVGSLPIVLLTGIFSGGIIALQMARALASYGAANQVGSIVSITLVRELGPVLTALLVAGRNASGMASELGSMKVSEQIDAMRALGTDPVQKLVTPRLIATALMLPCLTVVADAIGLFGAYLVSVPLLGLITSSQYWSTSYHDLVYNDLLQGLLKPFMFGIIISTVGCFYGLRTSGGTQGVGRATTQAVVVASIWIFIVTFVIDKAFVNQ